MRHYDLIKAKDYYGKHATGYVMLVDGQVYLHCTLKEMKETDVYIRWKLYNILKGDTK